MKIIDLAARETFARRLFSSLLQRAEAACGRGARPTEIHRAVTSRSAAKDGAMAAIRLVKLADERRAANRPPLP
ncbi:hypothetical protein [Sphingopyxis sp. OAS728]|uniref:hypothetical protein n=1 Tax=Sphingopyxis sp. OAS728 TaxID=2663823 RepID=UPI00178AF67A|nr:hypothetical protein [Sphingopyxis sp. OAS728]